MPTASLTASATQRTATAPGAHVFISPVVRELPRPAVEPAAFASIW